MFNIILKYSWVKLINMPFFTIGGVIYIQIYNIDVSDPERSSPVNVVNI